MYTFTVRIKKIGIEEKTNSCEFDVDNTIKINGEDKGIAFDGTNLIIVNEFNDIKDKFFRFLSTMINERLEVEFSIKNKKSKSEQGEKKIEITKVTVLR